MYVCSFLLVFCLFFFVGIWEDLVFNESGFGWAGCSWHALMNVGHYPLVYFSFVLFVIVQDFVYCVIVHSVLLRNTL